MSQSEPFREPNFVMVPPDPATDGASRLRRQALRLLTESADAFSEDERRAPDPTNSDPRPDAARAPAASMIAGLIAMPAAFLAVVFIAIAVFGKPGETRPDAAAAPERLAQPAGARAMGPTLASAAGETGVITLADDARIASIALDGDRVALSIESPAGREIVIYDYRAGRQVGGAQIETVRNVAVDTLSMLTGPPPAAAAPTAPAVIAPVEEAPAARAVPADPPRQKPRATP